MSEPDDLVDTREAAAFLGVAAVTLRQWRWRRHPWQPPFLKCGTRTIRYRRQSLETWARRREVEVQPGRKDREPGGRQTRRARGE